MSLNSRESIVKIAGVEYQKIEIENNLFYIVFKGRNEDLPTLLCDLPKNAQTEHLVAGTLKINRRKRVFLNLLKESCITKNGQQRNMVTLDPQLGIYLPESNKDKIKNKQIGVDPTSPTGLNFTGEF